MICGDLWPNSELHAGHPNAWSDESTLSRVPTAPRVRFKGVGLI